MAKIKEYRKNDGSVNYEFSVYIGVNPFTGKKERTTRRGFNSIKEAELELARINLAIANGDFKFSAPPKTFEEITKLWLPIYKTTVKEVTYTATVSIIDLFINPKFGNKLIDKIDVMYCQRIVNEWAEQRPRSFKKSKFYVGKIFDYAVNIGVVNDNPMKKVLMPRVHVEQKKIEFFNKEELKQFLSYAWDFDQNKIYTFFRLLAYSGMRKGEAYALTWEDVDFKKNQISISKSLARGENRRLYVSSPKTKNSVRIVSIDKDTMNHLNRWRNVQRQQLLKLGHPTKKENQILFSSDENEYYQPTVDAHWLKRIYKQKIVPEDFKKISTHGFRHTHASLLFEAGATIKEVQDRLGHSDITTTMNIYAHVTEAARDKTADLFADYLSK
ncbi:tyrosine-type recombinase/integrase [Enterococcus devriesei]|uniref:tyrosine-type recombinase/integrase n=1 Tax=Enterococcus devriesei TaxID=319970 RepID=UPI0028F04C5E|nr:tyrosine-type recombinase/integrase [Enterococcus devriesei]